MATNKLSEQELSTLKGFQQTENNLIVKLGQLEYQISILEAQKDTIYDQRIEFDKQRQNFGKVLSEKYGDGSINLDTGEITTQD